ncbi:MAG: aminotransferase class IV [Phaeodactylibacter sp.]|uniref:aminotransferase class IV n=1 Tax=Phaeodactylibacter sp. TaxID=1940289 RepID=UPI0032EBC493
MKPQLLETICCQDGQLHGLPFHQERVARSARALGFSNYPDLQSVQVPASASIGRQKCRVLYREQIEAVAFTPYTIRPVHQLALVEADHIDYACKYANRGALDEAFAQRGTADDILLVRKGYLTDTYYANIALWDGERWLTPASPLLKGTRRARLMANGSLHPAQLHVRDLYQFEQIALFNAMMDLGEGPIIPVLHSTIR